MRFGSIRAVLIRAFAVALAVALFAAVGGPVFLESTASVASAHSQLVSSSPGAGDVVAPAPTEIRLAFSEPIEGRYTSLDLVDGSGRALLADAGAPDPTDGHILVAEAPPLPPGSYTVNWRAVSASDGHVTQGFITFGVGSGSSGGAGSGDSGNAGDLHAGHNGPTAITEIAGKAAEYGALLLVAGLAVLLLLFGRGSDPILRAQAGAASWMLLLVAAGGALIILVIGAATLPGTDLSAGPDLVGYATTTRVGGLLGAEIVVVTVAAVATFLLSIVGRNGASAAIGGLAALVGLTLVALSGHAAGFASPIPIAVDLVHLVAAGTWLSGVIGLFWLFEVRRVDRASLRGLVPRFSAVALVSVTLVAATGIYQAWIETYDFTSIADPYSLDLAVKVAVFALALIIGGLNYLDGGTDRRWLGGFRARIIVEAGLALGVVMLTANLTSGSPSAESDAIPISPAVSSAPTGASREAFAIEPGRPGPNRYIVQLDPPPATGSTVVLVLQRLDQDLGTADVSLRPATGTARAADGTGAAGPGALYIADGGQLAPDSDWDAAVVVSTAAGTEVARQRFTFSLDLDGISQGRDLPPIDPALAVAILLIGMAVIGGAFGVAGGRLPRTDAAASRAALLAGSAISGVLGLAILSGGPR